MNKLGICLAANLPKWGKHVAHDGQARYPSGASTVPNFSPKPSLNHIIVIRIKCALN